MMSNKKTKILYTGGGTMGPVSPLLAIHQKLMSEGNEVDALWIGTGKGPERSVVEAQGIKFRSIFAGKWRRYFSLLNLIDPIFIFMGFIQSFILLLFWRPKIIITAGGFVSVPVVFAGFLLGIKSLVHQQDVVPGLANKFMAPFANKITVTFEDSKKYFSRRKTVWTGNPVRADIFKGDRQKALKDLKFDENVPVVLIFGGGTGAEAINKLAHESLSFLTGIAQIIHVTGKDRGLGFKVPKDEDIQKNYRRFEFLSTGMPDAYAVSDMVVCRAGMGTLSEIAVLKKPSIVIPIPGSHQEYNSKILKDKEAAVVLNQNKLNARDFVIEVKRILIDKERTDGFVRNLSKVMLENGTENVLKIVKGFL